jgi:AraC family transcriptional regulator of adaptative response / DNA-3-methyladenine glycosylase II
MDLAPDVAYQALRSRDRRFDGRFFVAVRTTGIYCRPICPAPSPRRENVEFYACAAAAEAAGFRACLRCRPEASPGTPAWAGSSAVVSRGLRLIRDGALDDGDADALAARLGVGARQLRRLFEKHLGTSPAAVARARRLHFARALLDDTDLSITRIAFAAGFRSVRQFNHAMLASFRASPRALRRRPVARGAAGPLSIKLHFRPPFDWQALLRFLAPRAIPGVEVVTATAYRRTIEQGGVPGAIEVTSVPGEPCLRLRAWLPDPAGLLPVVERVRRLFDLTADPLQIAAHLSACPTLSRVIAGQVGLRVPGAFDPFELAVRAILGQQVSVAGATTLAGRLVSAFGKPTTAGPGLTHLFPPPERLAEGDVASIGLPRARAATIRALAAAVASGELVLDSPLGLEDAVARLCRIPGIGPWTAHYVALRGLGEPDAFPAGDLGLRKALGRGGAPDSTRAPRQRAPDSTRAPRQRAPISERALERAAEAWRPWRAYAALALWTRLMNEEE